MDKPIAKLKLLTKEGEVVDGILYCHEETTTIAGVTYYLLKMDVPADHSGVTLSISTATVGRYVWGKFVYPLTGIAKILSGTIYATYRAYTGGGTVNAEIDILIRKSDGTVRTTIATGVSKSGSLPTSWATLTGASYSFAEYTVVDERDCFEIDYIGNVTTKKAGQYAYLRIDDNTLAPADQTRSQEWSFQLKQVTGTPLVFKDKYVVTSGNLVSTSSASLVDDTEAVITFSLDAPRTVLVIYQANNDYGITMYGLGMTNAINIDGIDVAISKDSCYSDNYVVRNCAFWVGTLGAGSHTIKGRLASNSEGNTVTISNRVLVVYIFDGNAYYYIDSSFVTATRSASFVDDDVARIVVTTSEYCKALFLYNASSDADDSNGKSIVINIDGTDYGEAGKAPGGFAYPSSVFTVYAKSLTPSTITVKGRFKATASGSVVRVSRRQFAVLLFHDSNLLDIVSVLAQVSTTSSLLVDDPYAVITRTITDTRHVLIIAVGAKRFDSISSRFGERYAINVNGYNRAYSRGSVLYETLPNSAATAWAETLTAGSHTIKGRFSNNYGTYKAIIDWRHVVVLWFTPVAPPPVTETIVAMNYPMTYLPKPVKAGMLASKVEGATIISVAKDFPEELIKKGKASELRSKFT